MANPWHIQLRKCGKQYRTKKPKYSWHEKISKCAKEYQRIKAKNLPKKEEEKQLKKVDRKVEKIIQQKEIEIPKEEVKKKVKKELVKVHSNYYEKGSIQDQLNNSPEYNKILKEVNDDLETKKKEYKERYPLERLTHHYSFYFDSFGVPLNIKNPDEYYQRLRDILLYPDFAFQFLKLEDFLKEKKKDLSYLNILKKELSKIDLKKDDALLKLSYVANDLLYYNLRTGLHAKSQFEERDLIQPEIDELNDEINEKIEKIANKDNKALEDLIKDYSIILEGLLSTKLIKKDFQTALKEFTTELKKNHSQNIELIDEADKLIELYKGWIEDIK